MKIDHGERNAGSATHRVISPAFLSYPPTDLNFLSVWAAHLVVLERASLLQQPGG